MDHWEFVAVRANFGAGVVAKGGDQVAGRTDEEEGARRDRFGTIDVEAVAFVAKGVWRGRGPDVLTDVEAPAVAIIRVGKVGIGQPGGPLDVVFRDELLILPSPPVEPAFAPAKEIADGAGDDCFGAGVTVAVGVEIGIAQVGGEVFHPEWPGKAGCDFAGHVVGG